MANKRLRNFVKDMTIAELQTLLASVVLAVDDPSFDKSGKINWNKLITNLGITEARSGINYQAITPAAFYASKASTDNYGIGKIAPDADIAAKTNSDLLLTTRRIPELEDVIKKDFFTPETEGAPVVYCQSDNPLVAGGGAIAWQTTWKGDLPTSSAGIRMSPVLPTGVYLDNGYIMCTVKSATDTERVILDYNYAAGEFVRYIGDHFSLNITSDKTKLILKTRGTNQTNVRIALTANFTTR